MKKLQLLILNCLIIVLSSCDSFLDIVPDDIATIDNAFKMRAQDVYKRQTWYCAFTVE